MAKAPKRTTIADSKPLQSTPDDWMPLTDAFLHIQQVVGGEQLAEEDLRLRLASGDVEAQDRWVTPGEGIDIIPLSPEDFQNGLLFPRLPERIGSLHREAHLRDNLLRRVDRYRSVATISSCAALTCTAYGRSPVKQRSRGRRRYRRLGPRVLDPRYGLPPTRSGSCGVTVTDGPIGKACCERFVTALAMTD